MSEPEQSTESNVHPSADVESRRQMIRRALAGAPALLAMSASTASAQTGGSDSHADGSTQYAMVSWQI